MSVRQYARAHRLIFALSVLLCLVGLACMFYLTLRASPDMETLQLPKWMLKSAVVRWLDHYGVLRNVPAFFLLAIPFRVIFRDRPEHEYILAGLYLLAAGVEVAQHWIPTRHFDWRDIICSWIGLSAGWLCTMAVQALIDRRRSRLKNPAAPSPANP